MPASPDLIADLVAANHILFDQGGKPGRVDAGMQIDGLQRSELNRCQIVFSALFDEQGGGELFYPADQVPGHIENVFDLDSIHDRSPDCLLRVLGGVLLPLTIGRLGVYGQSNQ